MEDLRDHEGQGGTARCDRILQSAARQQRQRLLGVHRPVLINVSGFVVMTFLRQTTPLIVSDNHLGRWPNGLTDFPG